MQRSFLRRQSPSRQEFRRESCSGASVIDRPSCLHFRMHTLASGRVYVSGFTHGTLCAVCDVGHSHGLLLAHCNVAAPCCRSGSSGLGYCFGTVPEVHCRFRPLAFRLLQAQASLRYNIPLKLPE
jgi:hypothetical protein